MAILVLVMKIHVGNVINRPPRRNTPMFRALTIFILKGIERGFRKYMFAKIPGTVGSIGASRSNTLNYL